MVQTLQKNIRVTPEQWMRVEKEAHKRGVSANKFVVELLMEALEHREWPRTEAEIHLLRSAMFTAQAIIRDMERAGREEKSSKSAEISPKSRPNCRTNRSRTRRSGRIRTERRTWFAPCWRATALKAAEATGTRTVGPIEPETFVRGHAARSASTDGHGGPGGNVNASAAGGLEDTTARTRHCQRYTPYLNVKV